VSLNLGIGEGLGTLNPVDTGSNPARWHKQKETTMARHSIKIEGTGTPEEILDALEELKESIVAIEESGEHDKLDNFYLDLPKKEMTLKRKKFFVEIKLK
jgi:predicted  nucleic acid-binding Zn-ribbon protein